MDGFTGNIALKLTEGVSWRTLRAIREAAMSSWRGSARRAAAAPAVRELRDEIDPEAQGGAYMLGLRQLGVVAHGRFSSRGFARAIEVAARGVQEDVIGRTREALAGAGALRPPRGHGETETTATAPVAPSETPATVSERMNREQIFSLIRAHLADELEVDPEAIAESTRFKEDLEADSLDLYTLVQELEDSYGVRISDEEAAKILTVGQAVDFVLASGPCTRAVATASQGPDAE